MKIQSGQFIEGNPSGRRSPLPPSADYQSAPKNGATSLPQPSAELLASLPAGTQPNNKQAMLAYAQIQQVQPAGDSQLVGLDLYV
ncbi:hypothetical protein [Salinibius halmophilus]|uniref:hypothetical protein n=1 Tax=Salinibius halmophilus TaxID=1853216 RepID=UPI000E6630AF|nr:hypothetical protein [Salinibius halmophilus]